MSMIMIEVSTCQSHTEPVDLAGSNMAAYNFTANGTSLEKLSSSNNTAISLSLSLYDYYK